jgi:uncharacterized membrane protein
LILVALLIVVLTLIFFSWKVVLVLAVTTLVVALAGLYAQHRIDDRSTFIDLALWPPFEIGEPGPVISGPDHPLYCLRGARRGPEPPAEHALQGRFR